MKTILIILTVIVLVGCIPKVPENMDCTVDGWYVNPQTGEIITTDEGSAIQCHFK